MNDSGAPTAYQPSDPYAAAVRRHLEEFHVGLSSDFERFPSIAPDVALRALRYLLEVSCQAQHIANINAGRRVLYRVPCEWLLETLPEAVGVLDLNDEWEFRRYVELLSCLDPARAEEAIQRGLQAEDADVREAAVDLVGNCAKLAKAQGASVLEPPW